MSDGRGRRYAVHGGQATIFKQRFLIGLSVVQRLSNLQSVIFIMRASAPTLFMSPTLKYFTLKIIFFHFSARNIDRKLQISNLELFALSPGRPPYKIAVYVPGSKVRGRRGRCAREQGEGWRG